MGNIQGALCFALGCIVGLSMKSLDSNFFKQKRLVRALRAVALRVTRTRFLAEVMMGMNFLG